MKTLLEKAKEVHLKRQTYRIITDEDIELVAEWLGDQVRIVQVGKVKGINRQGAYSYIAMALREAFRRGRLKIKT